MGKISNYLFNYLSKLRYPKNAGKGQILQELQKFWQRQVREELL